MPGIYSYSSAERLFEKLKNDFSDFYKAPSEDGILSVIFPLSHLRDWIYPAGHKAYEHKDADEWSVEEKLHNKLHKLPEYQIIRDLCNNAKHFNAKNKHHDINDRTGTLVGLRCGLGRAGDSFGVTHYLVDGKEIRDIFWIVYKTYFEYFKLKMEQFTITHSAAEGDARAVGSEQGEVSSDDQSHNR